MKLNNKGFSLVELLGVMVILGIILAAGIAQYRKYTRDATIKSYDVLAESASNAADNYIMDHGDIDSINLDELVDQGYLENMTDTAVEEGNCIGTVYPSKNESEDSGVLDLTDYTVSICCKDYNYTYAFPGGGKVEDKTGCRASENTVRLIEKDPEKCTPDKIQSIPVYIYTIDYKRKTCAKDANGYYSGCRDRIPEPPKYDAASYAYINNPCKVYEYHQRRCYCEYNKESNKFCSSRVTTENQDNHDMKIRYLDNSNGIAACNAEEGPLVNSYVRSVCTWGTYYSAGTAPGVMTFHGYQFFEGRSEGYTDFIPNGSWFHDHGFYDDRVPRGANVNGQPNYEDGCRKTCIHFTEKWKGPVE